MLGLGEFLAEKNSASFEKVLEILPKGVEPFQIWLVLGWGTPRESHRVLTAFIGRRLLYSM